MFGHSATTHGGSSGCPVFREYERRWIVVGLHRGELPVVENGKLTGTVLTNLATRISAVYAVYEDEQRRPYNGPGMCIKAVGCNATSFLLHNIPFLMMR